MASRQRLKGPRCTLAAIKIHPIEGSEKSHVRVVGAGLPFSGRQGGGAKAAAPSEVVFQLDGRRRAAPISSGQLRLMRGKQE